ncbi:MAG TPA: phosphoadenylyl-sulfate reductase [Polyangiaceae bacterium]|nr:phosphoadenylyl-sulfate reductase [Polyangiaceae bacterium]
MRKITMVKKLLASGEPCAKCAQAQDLLERRGLWNQIDEVVWANETDPSSPGAQLAQRHQVELAPFFIISETGREDRVVTSTLKLVQELGATPAAAPAAPELSDAELGAALAELATAHPSAILSWGLSRFGAACGIAFSGAEDVVLIDLAAKSGLPYSIFSLDTGRLHEETYRFLDRVRAFYGVEIQILSPQAEPLQAFVRKKGLFSFLEDGHGECCGIRKVEPLKRALAPLRAWATGQRRDQSPTRTEVNVLEFDRNFSGAAGRLVKLNPLAGWSSAQVWEYIRRERVPYNTLHDHGFVSIGCQPCTRPIRPGEHERAARWWWEEATQRECGLHVKKG